MKEFKLPEKQVELAKRKVLTNALPIILIASVAGIYIGLSRTASNSDVYNVLVIVIIISLLSIFIGLRLGIKNNNDAIRSYRIELLEDSIKKYQKNTPVIEISKSEIKTITEVIKKGLIIKTDNVNKYIYIPVGLEGYENLKESLSQWVEIKSINKSSNQLLLIVAALGVVVGFAVIMLCNSAYIVIPVGIVLSTVLIWSNYKVKTNPHVDARLKKNLFITLFPITFIIIRILLFLI